MKDYLLLLRVNIKSMLRGSLTEGARNDRGKIKLSYILLYILAAVGLVVMAGMVIWMETALYRAISGFASVTGLSLERILIGLAILISMVMTLLFGVFHTMGAMYFNRDTVATAHLPIGPRVQMAARWTEIYIGELLFSLVILLPLLINHGVATGGGVLYYLRAVVTLLITPMYPLSIALLAASGLARITSLTKHKEVWTVVLTLVLLAVVLGSEWMLLPSIPEDADAMFFLRLIQDNEALLSFLIGAFPPVLWALNAIGGNWLMFALYALVGCAAIVLVIFLMGGSFQQVCLRHTEQGTTRRTVRRRVKDEYTPASPFMALFRREMNEVLKTPIYLMNAVLSLLMMPIMLVAMSVGMTTADESVNLAALIEEVVTRVHPVDIMLILTAMFALMVLMCTIPSTAISREGKRLPTMRMLPVPSTTILWAKLMVGLVITAIGSVVMGAAMVILLGREFLLLVAGAVVLSNVLACAVSIGNILVDVIRPMLTWKNETEVMKQNMNTMFGMLISMVMVAIVAAPVILLYQQSPWLRLAVAVALLGGELAISLVLLYRFGAPRLSRLEP